MSLDAHACACCVPWETSALKVKKQLSIPDSLKKKKKLKAVGLVGNYLETLILKWFLSSCKSECIDDPTVPQETFVLGQNCTFLAAGKGHLWDRNKGRLHLEPTEGNRGLAGLSWHPLGAERVKCFFNFLWCDCFKDNPLSRKSHKDCSLLT